MDNSAKIAILGSSGMVGNATMAAFKKAGYTNLVGHSGKQWDLTQRHRAYRYFETHKPEYVVMAAAKVGGIKGNINYPADFIYQNLQMQNNVIDLCHKFHVKRLIFLGSSCIYPKHVLGAISEYHFLTSQLEETNSAYAIAKIAGIEMCKSYRKQYGCDFISLMPCNLYGNNDYYHPENSHVIPGLIHKIHQAKLKNEPVYKIWGNGQAWREFLHADDLGDCIVQVMEKEGQLPNMMNVGPGDNGEHMIIKNLATLIAKVVGFTGKIETEQQYNSDIDGTPVKQLCCDLLKTILPNWKPLITLEAGLTTVYQDYLKGYRA